MKYSFLIHIGYPKSGSSTLQQNVLMKLREVNYLAGKKFAMHLGQRSVAASRAAYFYQSLIHDNNRDLDKLAKIWREVFLPNCKSGRLNIVSDERFVMNYRSCEAIAQDLSEIIGEAKILMVIREQPDLLRSHYDMSPFYERDADRSFLKFDAWLKRMLDDENNNMSACLRYMDVANTYAERFGLNNVLAISFDSLFKDRETQFALARTLGAKPEEVQELFTRPQVGDFRAHGYKRLTRRVLGRRNISKYFHPTFESFLKETLRKLVVAKKTTLSEDQIYLITDHFSGHAPEAVIRRYDLPLREGRQL